MRLCVKYEALKTLTVADPYPIPRIDHHINQLAPAKLFSSLDLKREFYHIPVSPKTKPLNAFAATEGLFEYSKMPFGLKNAPATVQRTIDKLQQYTQLLWLS